MKWLYYDYMGKYNPVCVDAGNITEIIFSKTPYDGSKVQGVVIEGIKYHCDCKDVFFDRFGFVFLDPLGVEEKDFPAGVKHGDDIKMPFNYDGHIPITTDPRVLYIMYHAFRNKVAGLQIPTREDALKFLQNVGAMTDCIPVQFN